MRILITGTDGQVGWECRRSLQALGEVCAASRLQCDLAQPEAIRRFIRETAPDLIVHCAAYTAVDRAEAEADLAHAVNAVAPALIAEEAARLGAALLHLSTDYVFDGTSPRPYVEDDAVNPLSVYGRTKLLGEQAILGSDAAAIILRTSWVYATRGRNFVRTILRLARERESLRIVDDQFGAPTWARSIAEAIGGLIARAGRDRAGIAAALRANGGVFHLTASGRTSWFGFADAFLRRLPDPARKLKSLQPIPSAEYPTAARRPANSVLDCSKLARTWGIALPPWDGALDLALAEATLPQ